MITHTEEYSIADLEISIGICLWWDSEADSELIRQHRRILSLIALFCGGLVTKGFYDQWRVSFISTAGQRHFDFLVRRWLMGEPDVREQYSDVDDIPF